MYSLVDECLEIFFVLTQGYCLQFFYGSFLESRIREKYITGAAICVLYGAWRHGSSLLWEGNYKIAGVLSKLLLTACVLAALALCFYHAARRITVFLVFTFLSVSEISLFLSYMLFRLGNHLFSLWGWLFEKEGFLSVKAYITVVCATAYGLQAIMYTAYALILFLTLKGVAENFRDREHVFHRTELFFILAPVFTGLLFCILLRSTIEIAENRMPSFLYDRYPILTLIVPAILALSLLSILYGVKLFQDMNDLSREKSRRMILEKQIGSMQEHIEEMERVYSGVRSMKHDMKNTLSVILQLASAKEEGASSEGFGNRELQTYLAELNQSMERLEFRFKTGNSVADTLLNMKYHEIIRTVPDLRMQADDLFFPVPLLVQGYDLGIILGNALDNAGEACRKLKKKDPEAEAFIRLSSFRKGKLLFLKVENSFDGILRRKEAWEFPITDKADQNAHGIGLANIKSTVEKYQGAVDFKVTDRVFTLSVMIKNEERGEGS